MALFPRNNQELPDVAPEETHEFRPDTSRLVAYFLMIAVLAGTLLGFLLALPSGPLAGQPGWSLVAGAGLIAACFLALALPLFSGEAPTRVRVSPKGVEIERRDGSRDFLAWKRIRGYVHQRDYYIFLTQGDGVPLRLVGFSADQLALLRAALRAHLAGHSMEWRGRAKPGAESRRVSAVGVAVLACLALGGLLWWLGYPVVAAVCAIPWAAHLIWHAWHQSRRRGRDEDGES